MKKFVALLLLAVIVLSLTGCAALAERANEKEGGPHAAPSPTPDLTDILSASASDSAAAARDHTPPASSTSIQADQAGYEKALECVGQSVEELYAAVGQPVETPTYGPSCLQEGAEDGMLTYNGFYVWTVRTGTSETVQEVYLEN